MSPLRVAMVTSLYPPYLGGVETHVHEVARRIAAKGLDLTVLTTDLTGQLPPVEHDGMLTVRRYPAWPRRADLYISPALVRQVREGGYDLVHVQGVNNFLPPMALRAAQRSGIPTVATFHGGGHASRVRKMIRPMQWHADVKGRMARIGRDPDGMKILPGALVVVGETVEAAKAKRAHLDSLVHYDSGIASLNGMLGYDVSTCDPDGPLPEIPPTNASQSARDRIVSAARRENLTIRQLAARAGSYGGTAFVGTPATIADEMELWLETGACDGFNIMFPYLPEGLDDFVDKVIPELQARGLFRREYEGATLRENLGLARPVNRFFDAAKRVAAE